MAFDDAGVRWLFPERGGHPRSVAEVDRERFVYGYAADAAGPRVRASDDRLFGTNAALGPLVPMGKLPPGTTSWPALLDGGFTVRTAHGVMASSDGVVWRPLPSLPGYVLLNALIDHRGHGLGIFTMGKLAATHDHGETWRPFADGGDEIWGLTARSGKAVIARSSDRQGFWRQVDVETGEVRLVPAKAPTFYEQAIARGFAHPDETALVQMPGLRASRASPIAASTPRRLSFDGGFHAPERIALDGDRFLAVPIAGVGAVSPDAPIAMGRLGEGARAFEGRIPPGCAPHLAALCGDHAAVACGQTLTIYRGAETVVSLSPGFAQAIAFADEHTIVVATPVAGRRTAKVKTFAFDAQGVVPPPRIETVAFDVDRSAGGCRRPALWLSGGSQAVRWAPSGLGPASTVPTDPWGRADVAGVAADGQLVVGHRGHLIFVPSGEDVAVTAPSLDAVAFAEDGRHGLALAGQRGMLQTADSGRTWTPIAFPRSRSSRVLLCGTTRCQLGSGAYREGFDEEWGRAPALDEPAPVAAPARTTPTPALMCTHDARVFSGAPPILGGITPRVGGWLFAGLAKPNPRSPTAGDNTAVFGGADGHATKIDLAAAVRATKPRVASQGENQSWLLAGGPGFAREIVVEGPSTTVSAYGWSPTSPLVHDVSSDDHPPLGIPALFGEHTVGRIVGGAPHAPPTLANETDTLLVWGQHAPVSYAVGKHETWDPGGVLVEEADGTVFGALEAGTQGVLVLVARTNGAAQSRSFVGRSEATRETGVGIVGGPSPALLLLERADDGGTELRRRSIDASLEIGPPIAVPNTKSAPGTLLAAAPCGPKPSGARVRLFTREREAFGLDGAIGSAHVQRFLRVTDAGACVERIFLTDQARSLEGKLVLSGDGTIGAASSTEPTVPGIRCEPLVTSAPSHASSGSPAPTTRSP